MSSLNFSFAAALLALPLASLPVLLHLLFRRKSPVMLFSTIRFIQSSMQKTAARKRVQKWLLLACRVILLALLIGAAAQPVRKLSGGWASPANSSIAAIVVDTSYSMELSEHNETLLARANSSVRELLSTQLASAKVAIFRSPLPPPGEPERLRDPGAILAEWTPLAPQPNPRPLVDRVASAIDLLNRQHADDKWLIVISDFQKREFPTQIPQVKGAHIVLIDLHPGDLRSAGISRVAIDPAQPMAGTASNAVVDVTGRPKSSRPVSISVNTPAGAKLVAGNVQMAALDAAGHARLRVPLVLPAQPWMLLNASFPDEDDMAWDNSRSQLIETPPRQIVSFIGGKPPRDSAQFPVWLVLDPSEGGPAPWSLTVKPGADLAPDANVAVLLAEDWPNDARTTQLLNFVRGGGTLILFLRPGLEETWGKLPAQRKAALLAMLPSEPVKTTTSPSYSVAVASEDEPLTAGFSHDDYNGMFIYRLVPFLSEFQGKLLLNCFPAEPRPGRRPGGLLYRRGVGAGTVYTMATLPYPQFTNSLALHPLFMPLIVRMAQRPLARSEAQNIEIGEPLTLSGRQFETFDTLTLQGPQNDTTVVKAKRAAGVTSFPFGPALAPGIYTWLKPGTNDSLAITNVQLPAGESELFYTPAATTTEPGDNVMIARSVSELTAKVAQLGEPEPKWAAMIAIVLLLLCAEAFMGSLSRLWQPAKPRGFVPATAA